MTEQEYLETMARYRALNEARAQRRYERLTLAGLAMMGLVVGQSTPVQDIVNRAFELANAALTKLDIEMSKEQPSLPGQT